MINEVFDTLFISWYFKLAPINILSSLFTRIRNGSLPFFVLQFLCFEALHLTGLLTANSSSVASRGFLFYESNESMSHESMSHESSYESGQRFCLEPFQDGIVDRF